MQLYEYIYLIFVANCLLLIYIIIYAVHSHIFSNIKYNEKYNTVNLRNQ